APARRVSRRIAEAREDVANGSGECGELGIAPISEGPASFESLEQGRLRRRRRHPAERRDGGNRALRLRQQILVADLERTLAERRGFLARLLHVLLPHREGLRERPAAA